MDHLHGYVCINTCNWWVTYIHIITELPAVTVVCIAAMQRKPLLCLIVLISFGAATRDLCSIDDDGELATDCYRLFKTFESALIEGEGNLYRMGKAFFYSPHADPVLLKVVYHITYADNITLGRDNFTLSYCSGDDASSYLYLNNTNNTTMTYGWTSNGILTAIHPSLLNWMQMQLPLGVLRIVYYVFAAKFDIGPQAKAFLWDGSYDLSTLHINKHIESLPCLPSDQLYDAVLQDITALVSPIIYIYIYIYIRGRGRVFYFRPRKFRFFHSYVLTGQTPNQACSS